MSDTVFLSAHDFVAEGTDRKCFRHPHEPELCIKVMHPERRVGRLRRETNYYASLQNRGVDFTHLTAYHGRVDTNLGAGACFELVRDDDARVSKSLEYYLARNDRRFNDWVVAEMARLLQDFFRQWIVVHDLNPGNILVQRLSFDEFNLVVIDGVGHNHFIPLANYSRRYARRKLMRAWNRRYRQWYAGYPLIMSRLTPYPPG